MAESYDRYTQNRPPPDEDWTSCAVCGFKGINLDKMRFQEAAPITYVVTGTYYNRIDLAEGAFDPDAFDPLAFDTAGSDDVTLLDLRVTPTVGSGACPFCGTPRVLDGSAGDLRL